jgi:hypothetical protein
VWGGYSDFEYPLAQSGQPQYCRGLAEAGRWAWREGVVSTDAPAVRYGEKGRQQVRTPGGINCRDAVYLLNLTFLTP